MGEKIVFSHIYIYFYLKSFDKLLNFPEIPLFRDRTMASLLEYLRIVANAKIIKKWPPPFLIPTISLLVIIIHISKLYYPDLSNSLRFDRQSSLNDLWAIKLNICLFSVITGMRPGGIWPTVWSTVTRSTSWPTSSSSWGSASSWRWSTAAGGSVWSSSRASWPGLSQPTASTPCTVWSAAAAECTASLWLT